MKIITNIADFREFTRDWYGPVAVDTETFGQSWEESGKLLGISMTALSSEGYKSCYIPVNSFKDGVWTSHETGGMFAGLHTYFCSTQALVGHNFAYDKRWLARQGLPTTWHADTRLMWHLSSAPAGPRPYGLKDAQTELLGWTETNEKELELHVRAKGGNLKKGGHYLAAVDILAKYACLDTESTLRLYYQLKPFFDINDYWGMLHMMMEYNLLLDQNTVLGVQGDRTGLDKAKRRLSNIREAAKKRFNKRLKNDIAELEKDWADRRIAKYSREYNKIRYANHPEEWRRFNINSDKDKRELFYEKLGNPVEYTTESGQPAVDADSIKRMPGNFVEAYLKYEKANTLLTNYVDGYLASLGLDSRIHPGFNICGTVSYRLSGFKPYLLNAPFDEKLILKNFKVDEGYIGVHSDLAAIEPTITAHYSEDPALLKVFQEGLGDIYLDLALVLFPHNKELQDGYNPNVPVTKEIKKRFERQRKIAKGIQLAVQYTGTGVTVARNLSKEGIETSVEEATLYVRAYWRKFRRVQEFNYRLQELNRKQGYLRNVIGRIIRVPSPDYKDLPNRFIQSSAHDILILWVLEIWRLCADAGIELRPVLLDCHDSTSNQVPVDRAKEVIDIYKTALDNINRRLELSVTIRAEYKTFKTLAGLKGDET